MPGRRRHNQSPTFDLARVQELVRAESYHITESAFEGAEDIYWDEDDIVDCVLSLSADDDFEQTYESRDRPGTFQDVYKPRRHGYELFIKLRVVQNRQAVIISFKRNTSP
jgi:hypothetical protein